MGTRRANIKPAILEALSENGQLNYVQLCEIVKHPHRALQQACGRLRHNGLIGNTLKKGGSHTNKCFLTDAGRAELVKYKSANGADKPEVVVSHGVLSRNTVTLGATNVELPTEDTTANALRRMAVALNGYADDLDRAPAMSEGLVASLELALEEAKAAQRA